MTKLTCRDSLIGIDPRNRKFIATIRIHDDASLKLAARVM
jgi:hypothetical protein